MRLAVYARWFGEKGKSLRSIRKIEWEISFYSKELYFVMKKKINKKTTFFRLYKIKIHYEFMFQKKLS